MNGRLKELAAMANFGHIENDDVVYDHRLEKFAQLIVAECAEIAKHNVMNISTYADAEFVDHWINNIFTEQIKQHFRVKE